MNAVDIDRRSAAPARRMRVLRAAVLALCCCAALGGCTRRLELEPCNIAERECQEDVYYAVVRLRGDAWDPFEGVPPIRTITVAEYEDELTPDDPPPRPGGPAPKPKVDPWDVALRWLGLVNPASSSMQEAVDNRTSHVAAYYSSRTQSVTVIDHGQERNDRGDTQLLVHELVHAFQDNEVRVAAVDRTTDGDFAASALIEGEAVLYEHLAAAELDRVPSRSIDWLGWLDDQIAAKREALPRARSTFYAVPWFVYPIGGHVMFDGWLKGGNAAVRELGDSFPRNGVALMARHEGMELHELGGLACELAPPERSFALRGFDRFGAMQLYAFLAGNDLPEADAWDAALQWRDDRLWLFFDEDSEQVAMSWRVRMASRGAADVVVEVARARPALRAERDGSDAVIAATSDGVGGWAGAVDCDR